MKPYTCLRLYDRRTRAQLVAAPLLSLANKDDPIIDEDLIGHSQQAARQNPHILSVSTNRGGHLGWLHGYKAEPWMHRVVCEYLRTEFASS